MSDNKDKFKDISYEEAVGRLSELIGILEKGDSTFDETLEVYKEAFEYYTFCAEYLSNAGEKVRELNKKLTSASPMEVIE